MHAALLFAALALGAPALKDPPKKTIDITGDWVVESQVNGGRPLKSSVERRYSFSADGKWTMSSAKAKAKTKLTRVYTVDAGAKPAAIDLKTSAAASQPSMCGIVRIEGDTLTLCYARTPDDRPTKFESPEGTTIILILMKRAKKE